MLIVTIIIWFVILLLVLLFFKPRVYQAFPEYARVLQTVIYNDDNKHSMVLYSDRPESKILKNGAVIIQGAFVAYKAYVQLASELLVAYDFVIITKSPNSFALFSEKQILRTISMFDTCTNWTIIGHSLGGVIAVQVGNKLARKNYDAVSVVLLASYPNEKLNSELYSVLSISGEYDGVSNEKRVAKKNKMYMPPKAIYHNILGGNHAGYALYGPQINDGILLTSRDHQIYETSETIIKYVLSNFILS